MKKLLTCSFALTLSLSAFNAFAAPGEYTDNLPTQMERESHENKEWQERDRRDNEHMKREEERKFMKEKREHMKDKRHEREERRKRMEERRRHMQEHHKEMENSNNWEPK